LWRFLYRKVISGKIKDEALIFTENYYLEKITSDNPGRNSGSTGRTCSQRERAGNLFLRP